MSAGLALAATAPARRLSLPTRLLHWGVALGILGMLALGFWLQWLPDGPDRGAAVRAHKSFGVLVLALVLARILWRWREGFPAAAGLHRPWERRAALAMHAVLIAASLLMPLSGLVRSLAYGNPVSVFGLPFIPRLVEGKHAALHGAAATLHDGLAFVLAGLIALHVAAALKHHLLDGDDTLRRMAGVGR